MEECITPEELAYQQRVIFELRSAQAAFESWSRHIAGKYRLGPVDSIDESGALHRGTSEAAPEE